MGRKIDRVIGRRAGLLRQPLLRLQSKHCCNQKFGSHTVHCITSSQPMPHKGAIIASSQSQMPLTQYLTVPFNARYTLPE